MKNVRTAMTLVEALVAIGILAVLISLLVPAVQSVRQRAARTQDENNIKQILLAWHSFASQYHGALPGDGGMPVPVAGVNISPLVHTIPYLDPSATPPYGKTTPRGRWRDQLFPAFLSPTDPSLSKIAELDFDSPSSYAWNSQAFTNKPSLEKITDGTSNTIAISQHYFYTGNRENWLSYNWTELSLASAGGFGGRGRSASFADPAWGDVLPVTGGAPPVSKASVPGAIFQVGASLLTADGRVPQATQSSGLLVGMFDGSVRTISPSVTEAIFWAAVTPAGGETAGD